MGSFISAYTSRKQELFHKKFRNKSLMTIALLLSTNSFIAGLCGIKAKDYFILVAIIVITNLIYHFCNGMYATIMDKYLRNFANKDIDTKIFAAKNLFGNIIKVMGGLFASFLLDKMTTTYCMIIMGIIFTIIYWLTGIYMKKRVGLKPEQYSKEETKVELNSFMLYPIYMIRTAYLQLEYSALKTTVNKTIAYFLRGMMSFVKTPYCTAIGQIVGSYYQLIYTTILWRKKNNYDNSKEIK